MRNFQQKREWGNIVESKPVLILMGILLLFFAWGIINFMNRMKETSVNKKIAENKITELQKEKEKLSSDIAKLKTDSGIEETIREKFGLAKEGEGLIVVVEDKNSPPVPKAEPGGFFSFFKNWFK